MTLRRVAPLLVALIVAALAGAVVLTRATAEKVDVGIVVDVESVSLTDVRGFTLRSDDGGTSTYVIGDLVNPADFPPSHLGEHRVSLEPVRVFYREEDGRRVAYRLEDAPRPSGQPSSSSASFSSSSLKITSNEAATRPSAPTT